jgi:hypothetical protein
MLYKLKCQQNLEHYICKNLFSVYFWQKRFLMWFYLEVFRNTFINVWLSTFICISLLIITNSLSFIIIFNLLSPSSPINIGSDYGLDGQDSVPGRRREFPFDHKVQTPSGALSASCPKGSGSTGVGHQTHFCLAPNSPPAQGRASLSVITNLMEWYYISPSSKGVALAADSNTDHY